MNIKVAAFTVSEKWSNIVGFKFSPGTRFRMNSLLMVILFCASFVDHLCYLCYVFVMRYCLFIAVLWSPVGKGLITWLSCVWCFIVFCHFLVWFPRSGVVLNCIDVSSLPPNLLLWWLKVIPVTNRSHYSAIFCNGGFYPNTFPEVLKCSTP